MDTKEEKIVFAAGCFWGVEAAFRALLDRGVTGTRAGYSGGITENPTYEDVCTGTTGHAEAIEVSYDPDRLSLSELLTLFWKIHDPSSVNQQGNDIGSQYRSAIYYFDSIQKEVIEKSVIELANSGTYAKPIVTEVMAVRVFYEAEEYHQQYLDKNPGGYCHINLSTLS
ncbi:MAG: peptide-methionine (S)-S-oxide reductase [Planctomycetota bacterium]|jgi:peptide-methionine (S)-S-oxide reductase